MALDAALGLSVEELVGALNKKLFMECARIQSKIPFASATSVARLTSEVDALEKRARDVLCEVITLRNSLRPVNRLPPEVIGLFSAFITQGPDPRPIIPLTHVCQYWRQAIISTPGIWASIGSGWKRLTPLCLERAGSVPLAIRISTSDIEVDEEFVKSFLLPTPRIAHLSLTECSSIEVVAENLPTLFGSPAPDLVSLELEQTGEPTGGPLSAHPLFWNVSKLKLLHLTRVPLYPALTNATSLVELKLSGQTTPFGEFIKFLRSNTGLELIALDILFHGVSERVSANEVFPLTHLRKLSFTCACAVAARALSSFISFPRGVSLEVQISQADQGVDLPSFLPSPPTKIRELLAPITVIRSRDADEGEVHLSGGASLLSFRCSNTPLSLDPLIHLFNTTNVREFHVEGTLDPDVLPQQLSRLPALEALVLVGINQFPWPPFHFLVEEPVLCSSLKTIAFVDCDFGAAEVEQLEQVVAGRKNSTAAWLHRVVIVNRSGNLPECDLIAWLREFVPRVDVSIDERLPDFP